MWGGNYNEEPLLADFEQWAKALIPEESNKKNVEVKIEEKEKEEEKTQNTSEILGNMLEEFHISFQESHSDHIARILYEIEELISNKSDDSNIQLIGPDILKDCRYKIDNIFTPQFEILKLKTKN